ncbi:hypothetical protein [Sphingomonas koreensis]
MKPWWKVLGIPRKSDRATIRRSYAQKLRVTNPEDDPQGFMALRQAYEAALRWIEHDTDWEDGGDEEVASPPATAVAFESLAVEALDDLVPPDPEAEARAVEQAELRRLTATLEAALRGPWHGDAAALTGKLEAILAAPAMIEITVRDSIENWLADLLADTIPRSDHVLMAAIRAFGWENEGKHPHAVWQVLGRIDEWRVIQALRRGDHALSAGWNALTRAGAPDWQRRISALRPGIAGQVQQVFQLADYQVPGIAHSFDPEAVTWWRAHLDVPRFGFMDLTVMLLVAALALAFALGGETPAVRVGAGVPLLLAALVFPVVRLRVVMPWRLRREMEDEEPGWLEDAWTVLWLFAGIMLAVWPVTPGVAGTVIALSVAGALWMGVTAGREISIVSPLSAIIWVGVVAMIGGTGFFSLTWPEKLALGVFGASSWLISAAGSGGLAAALWRISRWPVLNAVAITLLLIAIPAIRFTLPDAPVALVPWGAAAIAGIVLLGAVRDLADGSLAVRLLPWLRLGLWIALVLAALFSVPPTERSREILQIDPMTQLEQREPAFAALKQGNPGLHSAIALVRQQVADDKRNRDEAAREIDRLVNVAYRARLPLAPAAMIASELDIRLAMMREYRTLDLRACADGGRQNSSRKLSDALNQRHYRHALTVAGSAPASPADRRAGRAVPTAELLRLAAGDDPSRATTLASAMRGEDMKAKCGARIALMEALSAQPDADVAQTMRPALTARAEPDSVKKN